MDKDNSRETRRDAARAEARERVEAGIQERLLARRAREREEHMKAGRPQRGLFTGLGRGRRDDENDDSDGKGFFRSRRSRRDTGSRDRPRTGARRNVMRTIKQLPAYLRLLLGLFSDGRVSRIDRFLVIAAAAYIVSPIDLVPDVIPFFGEVDDVFLLMIALQRLVNNAGRSVLLSHWRGDPDEVHNLNFARIISAAGFFLPNRFKNQLFRMLGLGKKLRD